MDSTKAWAESLGIETTRDLAPIVDCDEPYARTASQVAIRAVILHGVVAAAYKVEARPIVEWLRNQRIWDSVTPLERDFLAGKDRSDAVCIPRQWKQEAVWTLLWMIGKVESLGLPTHNCDTARLVDEIIPPLGDDLEPFITQSRLRAHGELVAEDLRTYNLWCYARAAMRRNEPLPTDLNLAVLRERRYAFEWMDGFQEWDHVTCDA
ncbi:MAG: DUF4272 domain-containing protein [Planctomycetales bacterium]